MTDTTTAPGAPAELVLAGYTQTLAEWTRRALVAEATVAHLLNQQATPAEPEQAD